MQAVIVQRVMPITEEEEMYVANELVVMAPKKRQRIASPIIDMTEDVDRGVDQQHTYGDQTSYEPTYGAGPSYTPNDPTYGADPSHTTYQPSYGHSSNQVSVYALDCIML